MFFKYRNSFFIIFILISIYLFNFNFRSFHNNFEVNIPAFSFTRNFTTINAYADYGRLDFSTVHEKSNDNLEKGNGHWLNSKEDKLFEDRTSDVISKIKEFESLSGKLFSDVRFKNNIHFLKKGKVGGTTIASVLLKIALKYGALLLPSNNNGSMAIYHKTGKTRLFSINHGERSQEIKLTLFEERDVFETNIIRHPVKRFQSLMQWQRRNQTWINSTIRAFQSKCPYLESSGCGIFHKVIPCNKTTDVKCEKGAYSVFDEAAASEYLQTFDLVMITEQMSESIVVLASMLGFPVEELGSVKLKAVASKFYTYSEYEEDILQKYFKSEIDFYNLAVQELERKKQKLGNDFMKKSVLKLEKANSRTEMLCGYQFLPPNASKNEYHSTFRLNIIEILSDPLKTVECLPLMIGERNENYVNLVLSLEFAHRRALEFSTDESALKLTNESYTYNLMDFYHNFINSSSVELLNKETFV